MWKTWTSGRSYRKKKKKELPIKERNKETTRKLWLGIFQLIKEAKGIENKTVAEDRMVMVPKEYGKSLR